MTTMAYCMGGDLEPMGLEVKILLDPASPNGGLQATQTRSFNPRDTPLNPKHLLYILRMPSRIHSDERPLASYGERVDPNFKKGNLTNPLSLKGVIKPWDYIST